MHNHDKKEGPSMMWMMVICCALPFLIILIFGAGGKILESPKWVIFGGIAVMLIAHFFMMKKSHKNPD